MATISPPPIPETPPGDGMPPLQNGDRLTWPEFERRYQGMPNLKKAELIEGVVYVPSPVSEEHSGRQFNLIAWLGYYAAATPGVVGGDNGTIRLDPDNAPQPDAFLRILPSHGGQARVDEKGYVVGAPELVAEVAASSVSLDLHAKLHVYRRNAVQEYVVWRMEDRAIDWFALHEGRYEPLPLTQAGIYQSRILPGLWLDSSALLRGDLLQVFQVVQEGLSSPEHTAFVAHMEEKARKAAAPDVGEGPR
jgi:Uma2 family endonuclease